MKTVLVLVLVLSVIAAVKCLTVQQKGAVLLIGKECMATVNVDPELVTKARKGNFVDDSKLKEYMYCTSKKLGFQNEAGEPQMDVIRAPLAMEMKNEAEADRIVTKCIIVKATPEQSAFDAYKCVYENTPTHFLMA